MQQNAFTEVRVLLNEGQVKAQHKHALKGFSTKERTTGRGHLSWPTGKVLQGVLRVATYESALTQQPEASELADLLARVLLSPDLQNTPVGAPRANNFPFHPMLQIWECSKASLALKALLSVLAHDKYKSVIKLNHRTACPRHCLGEWDLMVFVCWLQLCSPWRGIAGCAPCTGPRCALPNWPQGYRQRFLFAEREQKKEWCQIYTKAHSRSEFAMVLRKGTEVDKTGESLKLG